MSITPARGQYRQLADLIRAAIERGDYQPGAALPAEDRLAEEYAVSRPVVNRALAILRADGLVRVERGRGTFVNEIPTINRQAVTRQSQAVRESGRGAFDAELRRLDLEPKSDLVQVGQVPAPAEVAALLGLDPETDVLIRRREMYANDVPVQLATSYVPWSIAEGTALTEQDTGPGGLYSRLGDLGHAPVRFVETITVRAPDAPESQFLRMEPDQRVYVITRSAIDSADVLVEVCIHVMPVHQWTLTYEWVPE